MGFHMKQIKNEVVLPVAVIHNKTGHKYTAIQRVVDCTNYRADVEIAMIVYTDANNNWYVRDEKEFWKKFTPAD